MKNTIYGLLLATSACMAGCDDYLSKNPNKGVDEVLNNCAQVDALFNNSDLLLSYADLSVSSTEDFGWTMEIADNVGMLDAVTLNGMTWDIEGQRNQSFGDEVWSQEFEKIFLANLIINEIDEISDLTEEKRTEYLAQAHFLRAQANWELASIYCRPYSAGTLTSLGLPLKQTTSYEESQVRATLQETYAFIEADLMEALNTNRTDIESRWLVSKPAVQAMLARFYLFTQQYDKAQSYAAEALKSRVAQLQDYNALQHIERIYSTGGYEEWYDDGGEEGSDDSGEVTVSYSELYGYSPIEYTDYKELFYAAVYKVYEGSYLIPSDKLIELYDAEDDLRFEHLFVKKGLLEYGLEGFGDDIVYRMFASSYSESMLPAGPTVPEMLLTEAEAMARQGAYTEAMEVLNVLRRSRIRNGVKADLTAASQAEAIRLILDERHREMPFVMYWQDVRRLSCNETPEDDIEQRRTFYGVDNNVVDYGVVREYVLPVGSKRYAQPLAEIEIARSGNQLVQNEY